MCMWHCDVGAVSMRRSVCNRVASCLFVLTIFLFWSLKKGLIVSRRYFVTISTKMVFILTLSFFNFTENFFAWFVFELCVYPKDKKLVFKKKWKNIFNWKNWSVYQVFKSPSRKIFVNDARVLFVVVTWRYFVFVFSRVVLLFIFTFATSTKKRFIRNTKKVVPNCCFLDLD